MVRQVKISNFTEVQGIVAAAIKCHNEVGVHDIKGSIADAKSILDVLSLAIPHNSLCTLEATGPDAREAVAAVGTIFLQQD